eukprot:TRINITY_DN80397_c0_g1_i1.p1 TRINITY_DN80397_c0_g1~~TRINITY_DN80397_c0_g1_i1.p1  ORF type:complete len:742 (+),score=98.81 TRINITY_DN80397_c0_g1_i1:99-2324(+)
MCSQETTCDCKRCLKAKMEGQDKGHDVPENPFQSLAFAVRACRHDSPMQCTTNFTPRCIAKELELLQLSFVEAHEQEVRRLQKLLSASNVHMTFHELAVEETPPCFGHTLPTLPVAPGKKKGKVKVTHNDALQAAAPVEVEDVYKSDLQEGTADLVERNDLCEEGQSTLHDQDHDRFSVHDCSTSVEDEKAVAAKIEDAAVPPIKVQKPRQKLVFAEEPEEAPPDTEVSDAQANGRRSMARTQRSSLLSTISGHVDGPAITRHSVASSIWGNLKMRNSGRGSLSSGESQVYHSKSVWGEETLAGTKKRGSVLDSSLSDMINTIDLGLSKKVLGGRITKEEDDGALTCSEIIYAFTESIGFDMVCAIAIVLNAIFMAYEVERSLTDPPGEPRAAWLGKVSVGFTLFFVVELFLRLSGGVCRFFCSGNYWNYFDLFIVMVGLTEEFLAETASVSNTRMIRLLRLTRIIKVFRTVRIVRVVGALRQLVNSLVGTIRQVLWSFFLILCIMFVFSVIFGQVVSHARLSSQELSYEAELLLFWGTLPRCMYTLYLAVSGGVSWMEAAAPLQELDKTAFLGFLVYVAIIQWVVLNVVTGVFCESAAEAARRDVSLAVQAHRCDRDHFLQQCKAIFKSIDRDGDGMLVKEEMKPYLDSEPARALFAALDIDIGDVTTLFDMLDEDGDSAIDIEEFMFGCLQLRGGAKALQIARLQLETRSVTKKLQEVLDAQRRNHAENLRMQGRYPLM